MVLIEVDDINIGCIPEYLGELQEAMQKRFVFGKWETDEADFRQTYQGHQGQGGFGPAQVHHRKDHASQGFHGNKTSLLEPEEFEQYRSLLYKINWVAHQTRPEAAGVVILLSSRLNRANIYDLSCLNKLAVLLRSTAQHPLVLHRFESNKMIFIAAFDAGGVDSLPVSEEPGAVTDATQGAWIIMASDAMPSASTSCNVSILSWRSAKLRGRVSSTLAGEALAFSQSLSELDWLQVM